LNVLKNKDFDFISAFSVLDTDQVGSVSILNLESAMESQFNQVLSKRELLLFYRRLCRQPEEGVKFGDFCELLTSNSPSEETKSLLKRRLK